MYWLFVVGNEWFISQPGRPDAGRPTGYDAAIGRDEVLARMRRLEPAAEFVVIADE